MNSTQQTAARIQASQHRAGLIFFAVLAFALIGSIVHDLGAASTHIAKAGHLVRFAA